MTEPSARQERRDARRRHILDAARERADSHGWDAVTTRHLADAIGFTQPVLYSHFPGGKSEIMRAVALEGFTELTSRGRAALGRKRGRRAIEAVAAIYLEFGREQPAVYEAMFQQAIDVRFASEDVGMGDPTALQTAVAAMHAVAQIGMPEARIILAQAVVHNTLAPKSNAAYTGINEAVADVRAGKVQAVPPHLRGSGYTQASDRAKGAVGGAKVEGYVYAHDQPDGVAAQQYLPDDLDAEMADRSYYRPTDRGFEARLQERWTWLRERLRRR